MKAISLWQPWASAMARGVKTIETRHWETKYRGPLAIHAAKKHDAEVRDAIETLLPLAKFLEEELPYGAVIATCRLVDCVQMKPYRLGRLGLLPDQYKGMLTDLESAFGNYEDSRWAWITEDMIALPTPIPFRGAQGFFDVPGELLQGVAQ